jgi:hypothetical protein
MRTTGGYFVAVFGVVATIALAGCGGGGSTSSTVGTATIQGSVAGTVFVAVDDGANQEVARARAVGTPKTFSMVVATGKEYRFYVLENDGTANSRAYAMYIGANNVFALDNGANGQVISLGRIDPDLATGRAVPANTPTAMTGLGASAVVPPSLAGSAFSLDNVEGTSWAYNTLLTSGAMGWEVGSLSFDSNGLGRWSGILRDGAALPDRTAVPYTMSLSGMLLDTGDNTFQCVLSRDGSVFAATFTDNTGGPAVMIAQKRGGTYLAGGADLTGTWRFQRVTAGGDNTTSGWAYGAMQFTGGNASIVSTTTNAGLGGGGNFVFSMDADGLLTQAADPSYHGAMSMDKGVIVATDSGGGGPELWVLVKQAVGTYSAADMAGDWVMHAVTAGNPGSRGWTYGHSAVDASGNDSFSAMSNDAGPVSPTQMAFVIDAVGVMTMNGAGGAMMGGGMTGAGVDPSTFRGLMNGARNLMVSTYSDGGGGYPFSVQVR